jgi:polyisoprenoid-binding protein YceI
MLWMNMTPMARRLRNLSGLALVVGWLSLFAVGGCSRPSSKAKPSASGSEPVAPASAATVVVSTEPVSYTFSSSLESPSSESTIGFVGSQVTGKHEGSFAAFTGSIVVVGDNPNSASVTVEIDVRSLRVGDSKLAKRLKSADFLDVAKFPKARFVSTSVSSGGDMAATNTVIGNLELHGVTRVISIPATVHVRPDDVDVDGEARISRKDFGLTYSGKRNELIADEVRVPVLIHARRASQDRAR